jgi:hypothetical protein
MLVITIPPPLSERSCYGLRLIMAIPAAATPPALGLAPILLVKYQQRTRGNFWRQKVKGGSDPQKEPTWGAFVYVTSLLEENNGYLSV